MAQRRSLLVVSNRGPVTYTRDDGGGRVARRGAGGLVTALRGLVAQHEVTWIASAISDEDRAIAAEGEAVDGVRFVAHDPAAYDAFYNVAANPLLWFVQHGMTDLLRDRGDETLLDAWRDGYVRVNEGFADAVLAELDRHPDAAVFFQDYHLYVAPRLVRDARPDVRTAHFVHIPWPKPEAWKGVPARIAGDVYDGLLANDVVGFHSERWRRNFLDSCDATSTQVTVHPIGVDVDEFERLRADDSVRTLRASLVQPRPEKLIVRVDRTDPSKNIVRGFEAFALLLERHPELDGRVRLLALLDPSRQDIPEYADYLRAVEEAAARTPGIELRIGDDFPRSVAAYLDYDVLFVNAVADGLNLVSKEGPLVNERDGAVVLSRNAGSFEELGEWALPVDPYDVEGQAEALHAALTMTEAERRRRAEAIRAYIRDHDISMWTAAQLADLDGP
jgi:trehalose 6-phosphate synthase